MIRINLNLFNKAAIQFGMAVLLLTSFAFFSCSKEKKPESFQEYFSDVESILLERVPFAKRENSPFFTNMFILGYIDNVVVVNELFDPDFTFKLVNLESGEIKKFGKRGEGPNELISDGGYFLMDHKNHQLIIGDGFFNYAYRVEDLFKDQPVPVKSFRVNANDDRFFGHRVMAEEVVFGSSYLKRFASYDIKGEVFETYEEYPGGEVQALAHQAYFLAHPNQFRFAYGMRVYPEFGLIKKENSEVKIEKWNWGGETFLVEQKADGTRASVGSMDDELHFFSTAGGNNSMFFLYSGVKLRQEDGQVKKTGLLPQIVYQLDWDGNPKAILDLGQVVKAIAVDPDENFLFAATGEENPELLVYKLP